MDEKTTEDKQLIRILIVAIIILVILAVVQAYKISQLSSELKNRRPITSGQQSPQITYADIDIIPKGIPDIYGSELGISFDDVSAANPNKADETIIKLGLYDNQIQLSGDLLDRYINTVFLISCEYCCGAESIIFKNGDAACGCAHSYAMRGLAKYLLKNHADEYTNDQILEELGKWKVLFFPTQTTQKAQILKSKGIELSYINIASNKYRGITADSSASGEATGTQNSAAIDTTGWTEDEIMNYEMHGLIPARFDSSGGSSSPTMVGGC